MNSKDAYKQDRKKSPKTFARLNKRWDIKMTQDIGLLVINIGEMINWEDRIYDGPRIEEALWKLLTKARRLK